MSTQNWIIFDADNTLWRIEPLYDQARRAFVDFLAGVGVDPEAADQYQRRRDVELHQWYDYDPARFPQSFLDTTEHFLGPDPDRMREALQIGRSVFEMQPEPFDGVAETLEKLKHRYQLGVVTAGDPKVQRSRLDHFAHRHFFEPSNVEIVERKTPEVLSSFVTRRMGNPEHSWMVGDSLRSDVIPAHQAGLKAIHLGHDNWSPVETDPHTRPEGVYLADRFEDILVHLK